MNSSPSLSESIRARLKELLPQAGVFRWGVTRAVPMPEALMEEFDCWIAGGKHGSMDYMERWRELRAHPGTLLEGARSIICTAFAYYPPQDGTPRPVAAYALGRDYHRVVRERLFPVVGRLQEEFGGGWRVCVDSAPLFERYLAQRAGIGFTGVNHMLITPGAGTYTVLAEILTTLPVSSDMPCNASCLQCGRCVKECPGKAIGTDGTLDASRCLSYLTIEYRGEELPAEADPGVRLYGCDTCQSVCPHNRDLSAVPIPEFAPRSQVTLITAGDVDKMSSGDYRRLTESSAISRVSLRQLKRNARASLGSRGHDTP